MRCKGDICLGKVYESLSACSWRYVPFRGSACSLLPAYVYAGHAGDEDENPVPQLGYLGSHSEAWYVLQLSWVPGM